MVYFSLGHSHPDKQVLIGIGCQSVSGKTTSVVQSKYILIRENFCQLVCVYYWELEEIKTVRGCIIVK